MALVLSLRQQCNSVYGVKLSCHTFAGLTTIPVTPCHPLEPVAFC